MPKFEGMTNEFRATAEFKEMQRQVRLAHPTMPDYLVEMAIGAHMTMPYAYRKYPQVKYTAAVPDSVSGELACVGIYDSVDDIPPQEDASAAPPPAPAPPPPAPPATAAAEKRVTLSFR
jgi:hypothetical protein